jgi:hypothetical protein
VNIAHSDFWECALIVLGHQKWLSFAQIKIICILKAHTRSRCRQKQIKMKAKRFIEDNFSSACGWNLEAHKSSTIGLEFGKKKTEFASYAHKPAVCCLVVVKG